MNDVTIASSSFLMIIATTVLFLSLFGDIISSCHAFRTTVAINRHRTFLKVSASDDRDNNSYFLHKRNNNDDNNNASPITDRRSFMKDTILGSATIASMISTSEIFSPDKVSAAEEDQVFYFGCGCFWHVQHEFVEAERKLLGRNDDQITARAGYAGGNKKNNEDKVCYHNALDIGDYGKLGHAEIVSVRIPPSRYKEFAVEYCKLFNKGLRPDQGGDRGLEYRNIVGIPGGAKGENMQFANELIEASKATGDQLDFAIGKGGDRDVPRVVWIMDSNEYPVYKAEKYHQFHDGFNFGENYSNSYNNLANKFATMNEDFGKCPNGSIGLGIGGL